MRNLVAFPILVLLVIFQSAVVSQISLLSGFADIMLVFLAVWALQPRVSAWHWSVLAGLMVGYVSGLPWLLPLAGYLIVTGLAWVLQRRVWDAPMLATFSVIFIGTILMNLFSFIILRLTGTSLDLGDVLGQILLPGVLLNLLLSVPMYPLVRDLAAWVSPAEESA